MNTYRQLVHRSAKMVGVVLAALVILWATLVGFGYAFQSVMYTTVLLMIAALATAALTRRRKVEQKA